MTKKIIISEKDNIGVSLENGRATEIFAHKGDVLLGDVFLAKADNILPSIEAAFVNVGLDKMGFIHSNDIMGTGSLREKVSPGQKIIAQVIKEPTGHKGPRMTTAVSLPGRFLVLLPNEVGVNVSKKITSPKERARLKSIVNLYKPVGVGVIVRTEAEGQSDAEIQEDIEMLLEKWNSIVSSADTVEAPALLYRDQDLLYRIIREACSDEVDEIVVDSAFALNKAMQLLQHWNMQNKINVTLYKGSEPLLINYNIHKEITSALNTKVNLPLGGYLFIQQTEALTVIDVNSGKFVSSSNQAETILKTNLQAADEIARQLKLRNIGGIIVIDFIDMVSRMDKLEVLEHFELALEKDKAKPQIGQLSDLGLVELTRHRQGQSLNEIFTRKCDKCEGSGFIIEDFKFANSNASGEARAKMNKIKGPFAPAFNNNSNNNGNNKKFKKGNKNRNFDKQQKEIKPEENTIQEQSKPQTQDEIEQIKPIENVKPVISEIPEVIEETPLKEEGTVAEITEEKDNKPKKAATKRGRRKKSTEDLVQQVADAFIQEDAKPQEPKKKVVKKTTSKKKDEVKTAKRGRKVVANV